MKKTGHPGLPVIALPTEQVKAAGGKSLEFKSEVECAKFFNVHLNTINRLVKTGVKKSSRYGFYFDLR